MATPGPRPPRWWSGPRFSRCLPASLTSTPAASMPTTWRTHAHVDAQVRERFGRPRRELVAEGGQRLFPPSTRMTLTAEASNVRNSPRRLRVANSRTWPASSTPVGPAPTTTTVSQCSFSVGSDDRLRHLEGAEDAPSQLECVIERLHARSEEGELVVPEVRLGHAGGDDEAVVGVFDFESPGHVGPHHLALEVEAAHLGQLHAHVLFLAHDVPQSGGDLARRRACPSPSGRGGAGTGDDCAGRPE